MTLEQVGFDFVVGIYETLGRYVFEGNQHQSIHTNKYKEKRSINRMKYFTYHEKPSEVKNIVW